MVLSIILYIMWEEATLRLLFKPNRSRKLIFDEKRIWKIYWWEINNEFKDYYINKYIFK